MTVLLITCADGSHPDPPTLERFIRYPEGHVDPGVPDRPPRAAPLLWIRDQTAGLGGPPVVDGLRDYYEPASPNRRHAALETRTSKRGALLRQFTCKSCGDATPWIRPWDFHNALENAAVGGAPSLSVQALSAIVRSRGHR